MHGNMAEAYCRALLGAVDHIIGYGSRECSRQQKEMSIVRMTVRLLGPDDVPILNTVAPDVFDHAIDPRWASEFLADVRHHLAVALDGDTVVGMASAVHYVHPDKAPELWVNEVAVAPTHQRRGIGRQLLHILFANGQKLGCRQAWVLTDLDNGPARRLYAAAGGVEVPEPIVMVEFQLTAEG